jgi:glycosyltransferase involved in cell wall biosynthesis
MECPTVTVLMPVLNSQRFLREAVDSILKQTWTDFELLVVNDGSTDSTATILESYNDPRLRILNNNSNMGVPFSLNRGLAHARGRYVARIDGDDAALPERLTEQVRFLDHHPEVALVCSATDVIDADGETIYVEDSVRSSEQFYYLLTFANYIMGSVTFRRDLVLELGGYDESMKYAQDYDLWVRISRRAKIAKLDRILVKVRNTETNISSRFKAEQSEYARKIFLRHVQSLLGSSIVANEALPFHRGEGGVITYRSLVLLQRIHERLLIDYPKGLQKAEIERLCNCAVARYVTLMVRNVQVRDAFHAFLSSRCRRSLLYCAHHKLISNSRM